METITKIPPSPETILCMMNDLYMEAEADKDKATRLKLLPMMSRLSSYLHHKKHKNGHYMTSPDAVRTLSERECMQLMESVMQIGMEQAKAKGLEMEKPTGW